MNICFSCDRSYLHYLYISISSILKSSHLNDYHNFYILQSDFTLVEKNILSALITIKEFNIEYLNVDESQLSGCRKDGYHIPIQTFYRYLIADLKPDLEKIIYLDVDIEVTGTLKDLWNTDLLDDYLGAAIDLIMNKDFSHKSNIGMLKEENYFNAGILLLNLSEFRKNNLKDRLIDLSVSNQSLFLLGDQDALNVMCRNKFKIIDRRYNFRATLLPGYYDSLDGIETSIIRHFIGPDKYLFSLRRHLVGYPKIKLISPFLNYFSFRVFKMVIFILRRIKHYSRLLIRTVILNVKKNPIIRNVFKVIKNHLSKN
jgi:lipopolysaccharide biosynthesis glycosyltransferase